MMNPNGTAKKKKTTPKKTKPKKKKRPLFEILPGGEEIKKRSLAIKGGTNSYLYRGELRSLSKWEEGGQSP